MLGWLWSLLGWDEPRWTPEERALFREAALAEPGTKQAHLRLAALLEKNGNPLGTMVRLSFEVPGEPEDSPKHKQFEELFVRLTRQMARPLQMMGQQFWFAGEFWPWGSMDRGLFNKFTLYKHKYLLQNPQRLFNYMPALNHLEIYPGMDEDGDLAELQQKTAEIFSVQQLSQITELSLSGDWLNEKGLRALAQSPNLENLRTLRLTDCKLGDEIGKRLGESPNLPHLRSLVLNNCDVSHKGLHSIACSPHRASLESLDSMIITRPDDYSPHIFMEPATGLAELPRLSKLKQLKLRNYDLAPGVLEAWAKSATWPLQVLNLSNSNIQPAGAKFFSQSNWLSGVEECDLNSNHLGDEGIRDMVLAGCFRSCKSLELISVRLGEQAISAFQRQSFPGLTKLMLSANQIPGRALAGMFQAEMPELKQLSLSGNPLGDEAIPALLSWPGLKSLENLDLSETQISPKGLAQLMLSPQVSQLTHLYLSQETYGTEYLDALLKTPHLAKLEMLGLSQRSIDPDVWARLESRFGSALR